MFYTESDSMGQPSVRRVCTVELMLVGDEMKAQTLGGQGLVPAEAQGKHFAARVYGEYCFDYRLPSWRACMMAKQDPQTRSRSA